MLFLTIDRCSSRQCCPRVDVNTCIDLKLESEMGKRNRQAVASESHVTPQCSESSSNNISSNNNFFNLADNAEAPTTSG